MSVAFVYHSHESGRDFCVKRLSAEFSALEPHYITAYLQMLKDYNALLTKKHIKVLKTVPQLVFHGNTIIVYLIQPLLKKDVLLPSFLRNCTEEEARAVFRRLLTTCWNCIDETTGLDSQASNWATEVHYIWQCSLCVLYSALHVFLLVFHRHSHITRLASSHRRHETGWKVVYLL